MFGWATAAICSFNPLWFTNVFDEKKILMARHYWKLNILSWPFWFYNVQSGYLPSNIEVSIATKYLLAWWGQHLPAKWAINMPTLAFNTLAREWYHCCVCLNHNTFCGC